jgi:hypothetical protein
VADNAAFSSSDREPPGSDAAFRASEKNRNLGSESSNSEKSAVIASIALGEIVSCAGVAWDILDPEFD